MSPVICGMNVAISRFVGIGRRQSVIARGRPTFPTRRATIDCPACVGHYGVGTKEAEMRELYWKKRDRAPIQTI